MALAVMAKVGMKIPFLKRQWYVYIVCQWFPIQGFVYFDKKHFYQLMYTSCNLSQHMTLLWKLIFIRPALVESWGDICGF